MNYLMAFSKKREGKTYLAKNFQVKEFACKDGSDTIFIDGELVGYLQMIRNNFGKSVTINSSYRTESYNKKIKGAAYSQHMYGRACDIKISGVKPQVIADYVETLMPNSGGIGVYSNFVHIDTREIKSRWKG